MEKDKKEAKGEQEKVEKLLWLDLEMSGLDVEKERILEVAAIVTNIDLEEKGSFESTIKQSDTLLDSMSEWCKTQHTKSGLVEAVKKSPLEEEVENNFLQFLSKHFSKEEKIILAGNSISQDKKFIDRYWKSISLLLHYRVLDVSSWKILFENKYKKNFPKSDKHRAIEDIRESIAELSFYLSFIRE